MDPMNKLSAVIITLNEERNIGRCLESLVGVADEVVVVDSLSTDGTPDICAQYGVRFESHPWEGYIAQKNYANRLASNDWILSIDGDEALSPELATAIQQLKEQPLEGKVFSMNRRMNYCGQWIRHGGWYPDTKIRIFDRRTVQWTGKKVHETLALPEGTEVVHLEGDLLHYSFYTREEHRRQMEAFANLSAQEMVETGKRPGWLTACVHTGWRFLRDYVFKAGFLDGSNGWTISRDNAHGVWYKYQKAKEK
ncbi:MAG: glycosyltransferase family 2 protein [Bacteroidales bacterium]|nr:glycosyltransferase family 2 protein [Bacteroidales bacterium]